MFTMSNKLKSDYVELVNGFLDKIPVSKNEDFEGVVEALKSLSEPQENSSIAASLQGRISDIKELLDQPELFAEEKHVEQFKAIVVERVAAKIQEFTSLSFAEKENYIKAQNELRAKVDQNQSIMKEHTPPEPTSEAHVISEEQMLYEQQLQFQQTGSYVDEELTVLTANPRIISNGLLPARAGEYIVPFGITAVAPEGFTLQDLGPTIEGEIFSLTV